MDIPIQSHANAITALTAFRAQMASVRQLSADELISLPERSKFELCSSYAALSLLFGRELAEIGLNTIP